MNSENVVSTDLKDWIKKEMKVIKKNSNKDTWRIARTGSMTPGQIFNLNGVEYKVAGDKSIHLLTEKKPSRKAWRRQQVLARKAERERKQKARNWGK